MHHPNAPLQTISAVTDTQLVERARVGDSHAFELIVRRHNQTLFRTALAILRDASLAQEAVQEGYLNAFTQLHNFAERATLKTWLTRIVVNQAITMKRRQRIIVHIDDKVTHLDPIEDDDDLHNTSPPNRRGVGQNLSACRDST